MSTGIGDGDLANIQLKRASYHFNLQIILQEILLTNVHFPDNNLCQHKMIICMHIALMPENEY